MAGKLSHLKGITSPRLIKAVRLVFVLIALTLSPGMPVHALSDLYYASGEDINMILENEQITVMEELEFELRRIPLFREVEDFLFSINEDDATLFTE